MDIYYAVTAGLRFRAADESVLRDLAKRDWTHDEHERSAFDKAADAARNGTVLVVQCMTNEELQTIVACFYRAGVRCRIEDMRVEAPA